MPPAATLAVWLSPATVLSIALWQEAKRKCEGSHICWPSLIAAPNASAAAF
jgi:hypothetical protein